MDPWQFGSNFDGAGILLVLKSLSQSLKCPSQPLKNRSP
jgi:hypothetical protein